MKEFKDQVVTTCVYFNFKLFKSKNKYGRLINGQLLLSSCYCCFYKLTHTLMYQCSVYHSNRWYISNREKKLKIRLLYIKNIHIVLSCTNTFFIT